MRHKLICAHCESVYLAPDVICTEEETWSSRKAYFLKKYSPGGLVPEPMLYDPAIHQAHRQGQYHPLRPEKKPNTIVDLSPL
jgi:hypothetical protein